MVDAPRLSVEGTITFTISPDQARPGVFYDLLPARFPPFSARGIDVQVTKDTDGRATVIVNGPHSRFWRFQVAIPACDVRGLLVTATWNAECVVLYLNGQEVGRQKVAQG